MARDDASPEVNRDLRMLMTEDAASSDASTINPLGGINECSEQ